MIKKAHTSRVPVIVTIVLLSIVAIGGAGYLLWEHLSQDKQTVVAPKVTSGTAETKKQAADTATKRFENDRYSFSYPAKDWSLEKGDESTGNNPSLETSNLTSEPFVVTNGAAIYVRTFPASEGQTYEERIKNPDGLPDTIYTDLKKTSVDGREAQSYTLNYEGTRYITEFTEGDKAYQIIFQVAESQKAQYEGVYKHLVESFKFK